MGGESQASYGIPKYLFRAGTPSLSGIVVPIQPDVIDYLGMSKLWETSGEAGLLRTSEMQRGCICWTNANSTTLVFLICIHVSQHIFIFASKLHSPVCRWKWRCVTISDQGFLGADCVFKTALSSIPSVILCLLSHDNGYTNISGSFK